MEGGCEAEMKFCSNCKRDIASSNYMMHEIHCKRNIVLCKNCNEPVPRSEMDNHFEENHATIGCELCGLEVEKLDIESHKDNCPKRPQSCCFCELEFPADDLPNHISYCGTRTEQCFKCAQFIMLKDQDKHDETNCTYPQNTNGHTPLNRRTETPEVVELNPFSMQELERMMNRAQVGVGGRINNPVGRGGGRRGGVKVTNAARRTQGGRGVAQGTNSLLKKMSNESRQSRKTPGRNLNQSLEADGDDGEDLDHLLALHLAHDLNSATETEGGTEADLLQYLNEIEEETPSDDISSHNFYMPDDPALPCEHCGVDIPASMLLQHQNNCLQDITSVSNSQTTGNRQRNNQQQHLPSTPSALPHIVDNLSYVAAQEWYSQPVPAEFTTADDVMLPCEFCDALFPIDFLVQHQAVCPSNVTQTPRVMSPAVQHTRIPPRINSVTAELETGRDSRRTLRRQQDPSFRMLDSDTELKSQKNSSETTGQKNKAKMTKVDNSQKTVNRITGHAQGFSQTAFPAQKVEARDKWVRAEEPVSSMRQDTRRKNSASRTQEILHDLVTPPPITSYDLLGHLNPKDRGSKGVKNTKNRSSYERPGATASHDKNRTPQNDKSLAWSGSPHSGAQPKNKPSLAQRSEEDDSSVKANAGYQASFATRGSTEPRRGRRSRNVPAATIRSDALDYLGPSLRVETQEGGPQDWEEGEGRSKRTSRSRTKKDL
ncbi:TRAF-type zinc finger domain-containing protein 1 isoform X1 [Lingula anatina]|uniref:TRAF-type zinc finger domain-containing protein 1 isoform X1 n=1 Tax=Lingula anatina TaxID=7574 RepID=A0A1S3IEV5_LINAN|nr:TRAF-type zinc finger domain-containing protein 1 isoform X1 [Lingula anatina]|eukprot:XP_013396795.1 TRAF-type zinc finger domain-containing protein 1 isoform X1 [Lingula anatina]